MAAISSDIQYSIRERVGYWPNQYPMLFAIAGSRDHEPLKP